MTINGNLLNINETIYIICNIRRNMGNKDITDFNEAQLRKRAASKEELNICLTNNYAFQKIFKNEEIVKDFNSIVALKEQILKSWRLRILCGR